VESCVGEVLRLPDYSVENVKIRFLKQKKFLLTQAMLSDEPLFEQLHAMLDLNGTSIFSDSFLLSR